MQEQVASSRKAPYARHTLQQHFSTALQIIAGNAPVQK